MDKTARLSLIAQFAARKPARSINLRVRQLAATPSEVKHEVSLALTHNDDQSTLDEGQNVTVISPRLLAVESEVETDAHHGHSVLGRDPDILTPVEQSRLARELAEWRHIHGRSAAYQKRWALALVPVDPFEVMKRAEPVEPLCQQAADQLAAV